MNWISFKKELPPLDEAVLILQQHNGGAWLVYVTREEYDYSKEEEPEEKDWYLCGVFNRDIYSEDIATHWMRIPTPPRMKKDKE